MIGCHPNWPILSYATVFSRIIVNVQNRQFDIYAKTIFQLLNKNPKPSREQTKKIETMIKLSTVLFQVHNIKQSV